MKTTKDHCPLCGSAATLHVTDDSIHCLECDRFTHYLDSSEPEVPPATFNPRKVLRNFTCVLGRLPRVEVVKRQYTTGEIALYIEAEFHGSRETVMVASCWVPGIPEGCVAIKEHSENEGVLSELTNAGAVDDPEFYLGGIPVCRVLF